MRQLKICFSNLSNRNLCFKKQCLAKKANVALKQSPYWKDVDRPLGVVSKRGKNLGDLVLKRKIFSTEVTEESSEESQDKGTVRCTPLLLLAPPKRGRKCETCPLSGSNTITSLISKSTILLMVIARAKV